MQKFSGHDKRVTLNLALHSHAGAQVQGLHEALAQARSAGWDLSALPQEQVEIIYAALTDEFEAKVLAEFCADPDYLVDLYRTFGGVSACPLCGHAPIRWLFKLDNLAGGESVECGSECILTYGLAVKGAETSEHARRILEGQIRKAIRALQIKEWHEETGFKPEWLSELHEALSRIGSDYGHTYTDRSNAHYNKRCLRKLRKFYETNGWLNTALRWNELRRLADFARLFDAKISIPHLDLYVVKEKKAAKQAPVEIEEVREVPEIPVDQTEFPFLSVPDGKKE